MSCALFVGVGSNVHEGYVPVPSSCVTNFHAFSFNTILALPENHRGGDESPARTARVPEVSTHGLKHQVGWGRGGGRGVRLLHALQVDGFLGSGDFVRAVVYLCGFMGVFVVLMSGS